jgi:hypothetical protein
MLPILVLCYVRVDTLRTTIESILQQPHGPIYISCDGPSQKYQNSASEVHLYIKSLLRDGLVEDIRISDTNEGTLVGVSKGINWFFDKVEMGIIIEDDLILDADLLNSLEYVKHFLKHKQVLSIGIANSIPESNLTSPQSLIRASNFVVSWGWATTRSNWDERIKSFAEVNMLKLTFKMINKIGLSSAMFHLFYYFINLRNERYKKIACNWDDLWQINCFLKDLVVICYNKNLITNIGSGFGATHTGGKDLTRPIVKLIPSDYTSISSENSIPELDINADKYFCDKRKVSQIIKSAVRIRTRYRSTFHKKS